MNTATGHGCQDAGCDGGQEKFFHIGFFGLSAGVARAYAGRFLARLHPSGGLSVPPPRRWPPSGPR